MSTIVPEWTGFEARALRKAKRMSVRTFAAFLGVSGRTISNWEAGGHDLVPIPDSQALLDTALRTSDAEVHERFLIEAGGAVRLVAAHDRGDPRSIGTAASPADHGLTDLWSPGSALTCLHDVLRVDDLSNRRTFLRLSGAALTSAAHHWMVDVERLQGALNGRRIDESMVADLDRIVAAKRRVDDALGGGVLYLSVREELAFVVDLLKYGSYSQTVEQRLYMVAAELARLAGWSRFDSGDQGGAQRYFLAALRSAHLSGDKALGVHILGFMAMQSTLLGNATDAITLLRSAHQGAAGILTATEGAALHGRMARAHGEDRDAYGTQANAERAFLLLEEADREQDPDWVYWCDEIDMAGVVGEAYLALGDVDSAATYLRRAITGLGETRPRDTAVWTVHLAMAYLAAGHQDRAIAAAMDAVPVVANMTSDRVVNQLGDFRLKLRHAAVDLTHFDEYLQATLSADQYSLLTSERGHSH